MLLAIGKLRIDLARHDDHLASDPLLFLIVACKIAFHVTHIALAAKGDPELAHLDADFFRLQ